MIRPVTYYEAICDKCGVSAHEGGDYSAFLNPADALEEAEGCDWVSPGHPCLAQDRPLLCPDCAPDEDDQPAAEEKADA